MTTARPASGFVGPDAPSLEAIGACVHCGICLPTCPTYRETKNEMSSPRGRLYLMRAVAEGRLGISDGFAEEMDLCLGCRACETACPAGVRFGDLLERSRAQVQEQRPGGWGERLLRRTLLQGVIPHRGRLGIMAWAAGWYRRLGVSRLFRAAGVLEEFPALAAAEALMPERVGQGGAGLEVGVHLAEGETRRRVAVLRGCVMDAVFGGTNRRTVELLQRAGCEVVVPDGQTCCGALLLHAGMREEGKELARRNVRAFVRAEADAVVVNSAGCGAALREYGELLADDPGDAQAAHALSSKVRDIAEFLDEVGDPGSASPARFSPLPGRAIYQDACHLVHGQRVREAPRRLLRQVPGLELCDFPESDSCCGSAGIYNITHPDMSGRLLERKMDFVAAADPDYIIAGNPGCQMQLELGVRRRGLKARVIHTVDALTGGDGGGES